MAETGYGCEFGDCRNTPNHLLTTLAPPSTVSLCDEDYAPGLIPLLAAELGVEPGPFYAYIQKYVDREVRKAAKALADVQAAQEQAPGDHEPAVPEDQPLPRPPAGMAYTNDGVLVPDDEGGEL